MTTDNNSQWIRITKSKKPATYKNVLLCNNASKHESDRWVVAGHRDGNGKYWNQHQDKYSDCEIYPTHYQPLPLPPKEI